MKNWTQGVGWGCSQVRLNWGRTHFQAHSHDCWQDSDPHRLLHWEPQLLSSCCLKAMLSSLPGGLHHRTGWNMTGCFIRLKTSQEKKSVNKMKVTVFCSLNLEIIKCHFCPVLFIKSKPLGPAQPPAKGLHKGMNNKGWGSLEAS